MFDDIPILPPRTAGRWHCTKCGEPTGQTQEGMLLVDPRYAVGYCECTPGTRNRVSGYRREMVSLVADFAWKQHIWIVQQRQATEKKAFIKINAGMPHTPEEWRAANRYRVRIGLQPVEVGDA